jgi:DNA-binding CsgD family transcriptional regulator
LVIAPTSFESLWVGAAPPTIRPGAIRRIGEVADRSPGYDARVLVGRDAERARIGALLDAARGSHSGALVVRGEPGIGKTALLEDAATRAAGMRVLRARGLEAESELAFAGLHQLLLPALDLLERLPGPQSAALQAAFGLAEHPGDDRFLISVACLTLLSELAEAAPVLCLVDDAQWLDAPSSDALLFVTRRLGEEGIVMLFGVREGEERRFATRDVAELDLHGLGADSAASLLARSGNVAGSVREALLARAAGNPLVLVELPAALTAEQLTGEEPLPHALPLTRGIEQVFLERVGRLSEPAQRLLLIAAADDTGRLAPVLRAAGISADALTEAEDARLVAVRGSELEFRHPLVRSAVYQAAPSSHRRAAHVALAGALTEAPEADQRAWHRAAAVLGPDPEIAAELEGTADRAQMRSGHAAAASALERAAELSADTDAKARRLMAAALAAWDAGETERAAWLLDRAEPIVTDPRRRADLDHGRAVLELRRGSLLDAGARLAAAAASVAPLDAQKAFELLMDAGGVAGRTGDSALMAQVSAALPRSEDAVLADLLTGVGALLDGNSAEPVPAIREALARAAATPNPRLVTWALLGAALLGDEAMERALLQRALGVARASGSVGLLVLVLEAAVNAGVLSGRDSLEADATEGLGLAEDAGLPNAVQSFSAALAWVAALRGREDECRRRAAEVARAVRSSGLANANTTAEWALGMLDLSTGRPDATIARLTALSEGPPGVLHPFYALLFAPDLVEACVRAGRPDEARSAAGALEHFAQPPAPAWALALAARCRALLAPAERAEHEYAEALQIYEQISRPFDRARTALLFGEHLRRERRRVGSREHLRTAFEGFQALGASLWAERAAAELRASGETARKRDPSTIDQLTPQELQIARFVAEGLSNKEVAAQLFISPRTVDHHLRNVFTKVGITSRTQLARLGLGAETSLIA